MNERRFPTAAAAEAYHLKVRAETMKPREEICEHGRQFCPECSMNPPAHLKGTLTLRARTYDILTEAIENGVACGWRRAHKHVEHPGEEAITESISREVLNALHEAFEIDSGETE